MASTLTAPAVDKKKLLRAHYAFQRGSFICELQELPSGVVVFSTVTPIPMWNHAAWWGEDVAEFESFLREATRVQTNQNRRPVVYLEESEAPAQGLLANDGFERFDAEAWMVYGGEPLEGDLPAGLRVAAARTGQEMQDFIRSFSEAYQVRDGGYAAALRHGQAQGTHTHYLLYEESAPVCVATVAREGSIACVYNIGTPPAARQKGHARRLLSYLLRDLSQDGCPAIFLQVENQSAPQRLYQKLGFQTVFVRCGFRLREWAPVTIERSQLSRVLGQRVEESSPGHLTGRETKPLPVGFAQRLQSFCAERQLDARDLFTLGWACLHHRYTGEKQVSVGVETGPKDGLEQRTIDIDPTEPVLKWVAQWRRARATLDANLPAALRFRADAHRSRFEAARVPLEIALCGEPPESIEFSYRMDQFGKDAIRRLSAHFVNLLENLLEQPAAKVSQLEYLTAPERHQLLVEWNRTSFTPVEKSLPELFQARLEQAPEALALSFIRAGVHEPVEQLSYRELNHRANRLAHFLQSAGVGPEVFVGVCMDRSLDMIISLLAILKAGGACVPMDPAYPAERIHYMLRDTKAPLILTHSRLASLVTPASGTQVICLDEYWEKLQVQSEKNPVSRAGGNHAAYVIYTSGSTGQPKGVVIPNRSIANHCLDCIEHYGLNPHDRVLQFSSFNFDAAFEQILPALLSGASLVVRDNEIWNTREFSDRLAQLQLTVIDIPTAYWHDLAERWHAEPETVPAHSLRLVVVGGEALAPEKLALWQETPMNRVRLVNAYGPTETTITATSYTVPSRRPGEAPSPVLPIGRPRGNRKAYVLDTYGSPTPIGVPGELHLGGGMLARGYHNRPDLTASRFLPNPFSDDPEERLYRTGDLVRHLPDGNLEFLGRVDDQVKIRGFRIELGEVESTLRAHPKVREALVLARAVTGAEKRLAAYVVAEGERPDRQELRRFLRGKLPDYMVPHALVILDQWPLLPNGKIDRRALPEPAEEMPVGTDSGPKDPLELQIQLIFERVLKRAPIAVDASFFELGGDSLQALELLVEIERATGKSLPLGTLYQSSTVETLAREVTRRSEGTEWSSLVPLHAGGKCPPFFLLHTTPGDILAYGNLVYRLGPDQPCYGFQSLGLKESGLSHSTVGEMTIYYTDLLQKFQPHGPYYLGGWCYGGIIAVEMARLLQQRGEKVALLALLETVAMPPGLPNLAYYRHRLRCFLGMTPARWTVYFREKIRYSREARIANRMRFRQVENGVSPEGEIRDPRLARLEHVYNTNLKALKEYRSSYYNGKVTLFNAVERDPAVIADPQYGWVGLAREIEVHQVPGDHDSMLSEPNVSALAARLSECLQRAQTQSSENQAHR